MYDGNGRTVNFEMEAAVSAMDSWVAFGLSMDQKMVALAVCYTLLWSKFFYSSFKM
jgi:hypothetical protein